MLPQSPLLSFLPAGPARRGRSNNVRAFNAWKTACANATGLLSAFVEQASSSPSINGGSGGGSTKASSPAMHLAGVGRVNLVNFSTCLHRHTRVVAMPAYPVDWGGNNGNGNRLERSRGGPGRCQTRNLHCWCARIGDGLWGGPGHVCLEGKQHPVKLGNGYWLHSGWGQQQQGRGGGGHPQRHCWWRGWRRRCCKCPGQMATAIAQAPALALACLADVTGRGHEGKAAIVLVAIFVAVVVPGGGEMAAAPDQCSRSHRASAPTCAGCLPSCNWCHQGMGREGCPLCGEAGGADNINNINDNNDGGDI